MKSQPQTQEEEYKKTELGLLPKEWEVVKMGDVAEYINGYPFKPTQWKKEGLPIIRIQNLTSSQDKINYFDGEIDERYKVRKGDLLISWSASLGVFKWPKEDAWLNQHIFKVENYSSSIIKDYFYYIVGTKIDYMKEKTHGSTMHHITKLEFFDVQIPLPPLPEQKKIAFVLSTIQNDIEKIENVINSLKEMKKSMMKHLFTYGPVSPKEIDKVKLKDTEIGKIPEDWEVLKLGDVADVKYGKAKPKENGNIPVIGSGGIYGYTSKPLIDYPSIIVGRKGTAGKVWFITRPSYPSDTTFYLKWKKIVNLKFLFAYLVLNPLSGEHAKTTVPSLTKPDLDNQKIPYPSLIEQQKIASFLSSIDEKIDGEENKKKALDELFKSMLHNLMSAKIRVNNLEV
jgi:type I restriction enzyme S subunit